MAVAKEEMSPWMCRPGVLAALNAIIFLHYGMLWVAAAGSLVRVVGRRSFGEVEGSPMLSAVASVVRYSLTVGVPLYPFSWMFIIARRMRSVPKDSKKGIKDPLRPVVIGGAVLVAFMMLIAVGDFVVGQSPLKGSQGAQVDSITMDLVPLGAAIACYFIILPLRTAPSQWSMK